MSMIAEAVPQAETADAAASAAHLEPAEPFIVTRAQLARAVHYWGEFGQRPGSERLSEESAVLIEVLATMDFDREVEVSVEPTSQAGQLILAARRADASVDEGAGAAP